MIKRGKHCRSCEWRKAISGRHQLCEECLANHVALAALRAAWRQAFGQGAVEHDDMLLPELVRVIA